MANKLRNIGLFNDSFPPVMDGVAMCVENYARWMQESVGGVSVITPENLDAYYSDKKYEVLSYMSVAVPFRPPYVTGISDLDPAFKAKLMRRQFRIVHAHCPFTSGWAAQNVAKKQRIPMVATFHSKYKDDFARVLPGKVILDAVIKGIVNFYESADEVWVPQESVKGVLYSYGFKGKIEVMQNGCDLVGDYSPEFFAESRRSLGLAPEELALLYVGQHIWEKNLRLTIETLGRIKDLPFKMFFIGTGYAEEEMKKLVAEKGLENRVRFVGRLTDRKKLTQYYAAADLFLFPSLYDTDGLVVREAAALHTPSIMLRDASASGMLTDGQTGFLIGNGAEDFEAAIRSLEADRERLKTVGLLASTSIVRSWKDIAEEAIDRYNSLINRVKLIHPIY